MRMTTMIWIGIHNVGRKGDSPYVRRVSMKEALLDFAHYMNDVDMATRVEVKIGRSEEEVRVRIGKGDGAATDEMHDILAGLLQGEDS